MHVFLIHGMGRTHVSLSLLARRLERAGHRVALFDYFVMCESLESIAARFIDFVTAAGAHEPFAVVGHSLGNVIARMCLPALAPSEPTPSEPTPALRGLVMLAPPNEPPVLARVLGRNLLFRALTRDAGRRLADLAFYDRLPIPSVPTLVVAGTRGPRAAWLPFKGEPSDGVVRVRETYLRGATRAEHVEVAALHTFIMNHADATRAVLGFLDRVDCPPNPTPRSEPPDHEPSGASELALLTPARAGFVKTR